MFRIFGSFMHENIKELLLFVFLHTWARACVRSFDLCIHGPILAYTSLFLRFCLHGNRPVYAGSYLRIWALTCIRETPGRNPNLPIFTYFLFVSLPYATLMHLLVIFAPKYCCILLFIFILASKQHFS